MCITRRTHAGTFDDDDYTYGLRWSCLGNLIRYCRGARTDLRFLKDLLISIGVLPTPSILLEGVDCRVPFRFTHYVVSIYVSTFTIDYTRHCFTRPTDGSGE